MLAVMSEEAVLVVEPNIRDAAPCLPVLSVLPHQEPSSFFLLSGSGLVSGYTSAMTEAAVPEAVAFPAAGGLYGEKAGGPLTDFSYVGIDAILEQMRRKAMKQGFELNIMVVGKSLVHVCVTSLTCCKCVFGLKQAVSCCHTSPVVLVFSVIHF